LVDVAYEDFGAFGGEGLGYSGAETGSSAWGRFSWVLEEEVGSLPVTRATFPSNRPMLIVDRMVLSGVYTAADLKGFRFVK
jgi:hypothetical protein